MYAYSFALHIHMKRFRNRCTVQRQCAQSLNLVDSGCREDCDRRSDEIQRKDPETKPIYHHRRKLPVIRLLLAVQIILDLLGDVAQLAQDRQQLISHARHRQRRRRRRRVISISGSG